MTEFRSTFGEWTTLGTFRNDLTKNAVGVPAPRQVAVNDIALRTIALWFGAAAGPESYAALLDMIALWALAEEVVVEAGWKDGGGEEVAEVRIRPLRRPGRPQEPGGAPSRYAGLEIPGRPLPGPPAPPLLIIGHHRLTVTDSKPFGGGRLLKLRSGGDVEWTLVGPAAELAAEPGDLLDLVWRRAGQQT